MSLARALAEGLDPVQLAARLGFELEFWQQKLVRSTALRVLLVAARQVGKSTVVRVKVLHRAIYRPGSLVLIVSASQRQADEFLLELRTFTRALGGHLVEGENATELRLANGSRIVSLPATPNTTRGFANVALLVVDEGAYVPDQVFAAMVPTLGGGGQLVALSTPAGPLGWLYEIWHKADGWEKHRVRASESGRYTPERLAELRALVGEWAFKTDYEAEFTDAEGQVFRSGDIAAMFGHDFPAWEPTEEAEWRRTLPA